MAKTLTENTLEGFYFTFGRAFGRGLIQVAVLAILARLLTVEEFGIFSAALVVISLAQVFSELGMAPAVIQRASLEPRHIATALTSSLAAGVLVGVLVFLLAPAVERFFRIDGLDEVVVALAVLFPIMGAGIVPRALLQRKLAFRKLATIEFGAYLVGYVPVAVALAWIGFGVWSLVVAYVAEIAIRMGLYARAVRKELRLGFQPSACMDLIGYSVGFAVARLGNFAALQGDYLVTGRWLGSEALGLYGRAYQLLMTPATLFGVAADTVLFPAMSSVQSEPARLRQAYLRAVGIIALITLPLTGLLIVLAPEIIFIVLGE
jgi:PST family polysaccharide transporter